MKRHVLNIESLHAGQSANALVLNQVDEEFPELVPSIGDMGELPDLLSGHVVSIPSEADTVEKVNQAILEWNLSLQRDFLGKARKRAYMVDDTLGEVQSASRSYSTSKAHMHALNGKARVMVDTPNGTGDRVQVGKSLNSTQLNVLFPFERLASKPTTQIGISLTAEANLDSQLEGLGTMDLQGNCSSYVDCVAGLAQANGQLYELGQATDVGVGVPYGSAYVLQQITPQTQGMDIFSVWPQFSSTITTYQAAGSRMSATTDQGFLDWADRRNRCLLAKRQFELNGNRSRLSTICPRDSYELELAQFGPNSVLCVDVDQNGDPAEVAWEVDLTYRGLNRIKRGLQADGHSTLLDSEWVAIRLPKRADDPKGESMGYWAWMRQRSPHFGFRFDLDENYLSGQDRILEIEIPPWAKVGDRFQFHHCSLVEDKCLGQMEWAIDIGESNLGSWTGGQAYSREELTLDEETLQAGTISLAVRIHFAVDFKKKSLDPEYRKILQGSGVVIWNPTFRRAEERDTDTFQPFEASWGMYVNEAGITEEEREARMNSYFLDVNTWQKACFQSILKTPLGRVGTSQLPANNYSTGDIRGEVLTTKSHLKPIYDMEVFDQPTSSSCVVPGRRYVGLGSCGNQIYLTYEQCRFTFVDGLLEVDNPREYNPDLDDMTTYSQMDSGVFYTPHVMVETIRNENVFESSVRHKSNVYSIVVSHSNLAESQTDDSTTKDWKRRLREQVTQFTRRMCEQVAPAHTQLFDVQFT